MVCSIPAGALKLLDLIGSVEAPRGYDTLFRNSQNKWPQRLTTMTVEEVIAAGPTWTNEFGSSAAGRYQFMTGTLKGLRVKERLGGNEAFDPDLQDRLGYALLDQRGFEHFITGKCSVVDFGLALAKEWASFPVMQECQGAHRRVERGETFYAGDHLNRALLKPERVEAMLESISPAFSVETLAKLETDELAASNDHDKIASIVSLASDPRRSAEIRAEARKAMVRVYGEETAKNACAATLCCFLAAGGIDFPLLYGAGELAHYLEHDRGWTRVAVGRQEVGDVAVCKDNRPPAGADHVYLVVKCLDADRMLIADNQTPFCPHERFASGRRQTPVDYFLRAPSVRSIGGLTVYSEQLELAVPDDECVYDDQDTNDLRVSYDGNGKPLKIDPRTAA